MATPLETTSRYLWSQSFLFMIQMYNMSYMNTNFKGFFLRHRPVSLHTISYAINYWSKGQVQANFLRHEGKYFYRL